jgi:hypothetical protein
MLWQPRNQVPIQHPIVLRCAPRNITEQNIAQIMQVLADHPDWNRQQLSVHICKLWNWRGSDGVLNHRTCRDLLARLQRQGRIQLPGSKRPCRRRTLPAAAEEGPMEVVSDLNLDRLAVRPITVEERLRWRQLMHQHHYLGFQGIVGESICYVATIDDRWVALVAWGVAAMKNRHRKTWIGWDETLKWRRLHLVANNARFLILPGVHIKNLVSKVLSANLRRLSRDWQER